MKKLCLAVIFSVLLIISNARADMHGEFVRVECNKTLGFFEIKEETIYGEQADKFFNEKDSYIKYSSDNDKFKTEVYWVNSFANTEEDGPFTYRCQISDTLAYDIEIETMRRGDCIYNANSLVNITEISRNPKSGQVEEQKLVKNLLIGCEGKVNKILWSQHSVSEKEYSVIFEKGDFWVYMDEQKHKPFTETSIVEEYEEIKRHFAEIEREQEERRKETAKLLGQYKE